MAEPATHAPVQPADRDAIQRAGELLRQVDAEGHLTVWEHDSLGRTLVETRPEGIRIERTWDAASRPLSYADALGNVTTWTYDALGRATRITYPDATAESFVYDAAGNRVQHTDARGHAIDVAFDPLGRPTSRVVTPAPGTTLVGPTVESYQYDGVGRLVRGQSGSVVTERSWDTLGRLVAETTDGRTISHSHDVAGNRTASQYASGYQVSRSFDALHRLTSVGGDGAPSAMSYGYRGPGLAVAQRSLGDGALAGATAFDAARRPTGVGLDRGDGKSVFQESLAWSPRHLKTAQSRGDLNGAGSAFAYDGAGRIATAARLPDAVAQVGPNAALPADAPGLTDALERFSYAYL